MNTINRILTASILCSAVFIALNCVAESVPSQTSVDAPAGANTPPSNSTVPSSDMGNHPCHGLKKACEDAGFIKGGYKQGKGLYKDCLKPIMQGQTVKGVTVNPNDLAACQAKHQQKMQMKKGSNPEQ